MWHRAVKAGTRVPAFVVFEGDPVAQRRALSYHVARFSTAPLAGLDGGFE